MASLLLSAGAQAQVTPGYPERVLQWTTQPGETCGQIATALYGSGKHAGLLTRYNDISCDGQSKLPAGLTLVVPERVTNLPAATLQALSPEVRARLAGGDWLPASPGMSLHRNDSVNTLQRARADILFTDRTRVVMSEHTLVVIYGTAAQSQATKKQPSSIELEEGELQTAMAALRAGSKTSLAIKGGGKVEAHSKDAVVRSRNKRTTVAVFEGSANVSSGGSQVKVPTNYGSSFVEAHPPTPPRPLPPAPVWSGDCSRGALLAAAGEGTILANWNAVPKAKTYRVEVAHEPQFQAPIIREEVPANITSFRAERLPAGNYYVRVRTIDDEDFLGLASESLAIELVAVTLQGAGGSIHRGVIQASPYAILTFAHMESLEVALDDGSFGPMPAEIDLLKQHPKQLRFRQQGASKETLYSIHYRSPHAEGSIAESGAFNRITVVFRDADDLDIHGRVQPAARVHLGTGTKVFPLEQSALSGTWEANVPAVEGALLRVDVTDSRGTVLGTIQSANSEPAAAPEKKRDEVTWATGPCSPMLTSSVLTSVGWWAPSSCDAASIAASAGEDRGQGWLGGGKLRASGMLGPIGIEGLLQTSNTGNGSQADNAAWIGGRWRVLTLRNTWSMGPALRFGLPPTSNGPNERVEAGWAISLQSQHLSWVTDLGGRKSLANQAQRASTPDGQFFLITGATWEMRNWLSSYFVVDAHMVRDDSNAHWLGRGGATIGLETRTDVFAGWALRLSPWDNSGGRVLGQLTFGLRH